MLLLFHILFNDVSAPLALLILTLTSILESPSIVTLVPRYVNSATSSMSRVPFIVMGSFVEQFVRSGFVLVAFTLSPIDSAFQARSSLLRWMSLRRRDNSTTSSAKSRSSNSSVKVHLIPFGLPCIVSLISQSMLRVNKRGQSIQPCFTPVLVMSADDPGF